jgi:hypothetical protein
VRCFVISPIGSPGSEIREHADDVFDFIIKPACERAGVTPVRADHDTRPGVITEQMYDSILGDHLLIAVLSFHNPNVFYEIAIAEAAARPLILMLRQGDAVPFDIKDRRILNYDLRPRALHDKTHENALHLMIADAIAAQELGDRKVPFRPSLSPLNSRPDNFSTLDRTNSLDPGMRIDLVDRAKTFMYSRGLAFFNVPKRDDFLKALGNALDRNVRVRVLLMDPDNPALGHQLRGFSSNYLDTVRSEIAAGIEVWSDVLGERGELRLQTRGFMSGMLQMNDSKAIVTPYSLSASTADSPCLITDASHRIHQAAKEEFEFVWVEASRPAVRNQRHKAAVSSKATSTAQKARGKSRGRRVSRAGGGDRASR